MNLMNRVIDFTAKKDIHEEQTQAKMKTEAGELRLIINLSCFRSYNKVGQ